MAKPETCLHCAIMEVIADFHKDKSDDDFDVVAILTDLGEAAGHAMATAGVRLDAAIVGPLLQALLQSTADNFSAYSKLIAVAERREHAGRVLQ